MPLQLVKSPDSYLGAQPICDICKKDIKVNDVVRQEFTGIVAFDDDCQELGIVENSYVLIHITCEPIQ
jgi:hypothetical protein